jgi:hypothetical protein
LRGPELIGSTITVCLPTSADQPAADSPLPDGPK